MTACEGHGQWISLYLDGEPHLPELTEFESHLSACPACQAAVAGCRRFLADLSDARPRYGAPPELRLRIERLVADAVAQSKAQASGSGSWWKMQRWIPVRSGLPWASPQVAVAMLLLLLTIAGGLWMERQTRRPPLSEFASAALQAHKRRLRGALSSELRSSSPEAISAWFQGKVPFHVKLPNNEDLPTQQQPYQIEGAGIEPFAGGRVGYIAYRVGNKPVSLLLAPTSAVRLSGRNRVPMKSLVIHYDEADGFHIVTWAVTRKAVTYALVSDSSQHPNQSCIVCHAGPKDREFMRNLVRQ
jgi:anti-sigma factor RsiW